jgi:arylsulfatase
VRSQWHHVIDITPTILEAAGLPEPTSVNGTLQTPIEGVSMLYSFADAKTPSRHTTQYFEIFGNRAIYRDGWLAGTVHRAAWEFKVRRPLQDDAWELYDTRTDFSLANDLATKNPEKLKELQTLFLSEAVKYSVLPLDDRTLERLNSAMVGRPDLMAGRASLTVYQGMTGMSENVFMNTKNRSHMITAEVQIPKKGANGVILAQAGRFGGWSLYVRGGKPTYTYNWLGLHRYTIAAKQALPAGKATVRYEFAYDGGVGKGGTGTLFVNGKKVATGRVEQTQCCAFSADEGTDVGSDEGTPVTEAYKVPFKFTGKIAKVTIDLQEMKAATASEVEKSRKEAALKKGLSD